MIKPLVRLSIIRSPRQLRLRTHIALPIRKNSGTFTRLAVQKMTGEQHGHELRSDTPNKNFRIWSDHALGTAAAVFSLDYIFLHELAHASLGHLDYLGSMGLVQRLREVDTAPAGLPIQLFHAMELQADYFAGVQLAQTIIQP